MLHSPWQRPGLGKAEEAQPQVPAPVLRRQHVHTHNSPLMHFPTALKGVTHSHLKILEECQDTGPIEALLLYVMQLEDKGGGSWGLATALSQ